MAGTFMPQRAYDRWDEMKWKDLSKTAEKNVKFERNPKLEAFQYPESAGHVHRSSIHRTSTGMLPLFMLSHFNCPANDQRCKATVVFCASIWHYFLYRMYHLAQEKEWLQITRNATGEVNFSDLPNFVQLSWYAVLFFFLALFSIITLDCAMAIVKYVFVDSFAYLTSAVVGAGSRMVNNPASIISLGREVPKYPAPYDVASKYSAFGSSPLRNVFGGYRRRAKQTPYEFALKYRQNASFSA